MSDGTQAYFQPRVAAELCDGCGLCAEACPSALIRVARRWQVSWLYCDGCARCARACPTGALTVAPLEPPSARVEEMCRLSPSDAGAVLLAVAIAAARIRRGGVGAAVVASLSGSTAVLLARAIEDTTCRVVCVADTPDWIAWGHPYPTLDERHHRELLARGVRVLRDYVSSSEGAPRYEAALGADVPLSPAEARLFWDGLAAAGGEGLKAAVKSVVLATDHGLIRRGERVVCLGGTGGREAVAVLDALSHADLLSGAPGTRLHLREILCLPAV